jgi:hypothetical protein
MSVRGDRVLLVWLLTVVAGQVVCFGVELFCSDCVAQVVFDPRLVLLLFQDTDFPVLSLVVALIIAGSSWAISRGRTAALLYFLFELLYGAVAILAAAVGMVEGTGPASGYGEAVLPIGLVIYLFASLIPGLLAFRMYLAQHPENPRRVIAASGGSRGLKQ